MERQEIIAELNNAGEWIDAVSGYSDENESEHILNMLNAIEHAIEILQSN